MKISTGKNKAGTYDLEFIQPRIDKYANNFVVLKGYSEELDKVVTIKLTSEELEQILNKLSKLNAISRTLLLLSLNWVYPNWPRKISQLELSSVSSMRENSRS